MRNFIAPAAILLTILVISAGQVQSQVATGTPRFNSYGGGPFDSINLGNLNVHFTIPIVHKAGRGMTFAFDLAYDSSVWRPVTTGTTTRWTPAANWGWQQKGSVGKISYTMTSSVCQYFVTQTQQWYTAYTQFFYTNWTFTDDSGVAHPLSGSTQTWSGVTQPSTSCASTPPDVPTATGSATDGSGYTLAISSYTHGVVTSTGGTKVDNTSGITITDANGNRITSDASGNYFSTLSGTDPVLSVSGGNFTYTAPGGSKQITTTYKNYTVKTNFLLASPNVSEYGPLAGNLIDTINMPDGTQYKFSYEQTPGTCTPISGTDPASCVTARIATITLPTGGTITYSYSGGSNGILSDGSTAGLSRTLNPGGTWTYARSGSGSNWTTTINSPSHPTSSGGTTVDGTILTFVKDSGTPANYNFHETWRKVYDGGTSGTLLGTAETTYNGGTWPQTSVLSPITATQFTVKDPTGSMQELSWTNYNTVGLPTTISEGNVGGRYE